jgi:hypothetical protein
VLRWEVPLAITLITMGCWARSPAAQLVVMKPRNIRKNRTCRRVNQTETLTKPWALRPARSVRFIKGRRKVAFLVSGPLIRDADFFSLHAGFSLGPGLEHVPKKGDLGCCARFLVHDRALFRLYVRTAIISSAILVAIGAAAVPAAAQTTTEYYCGRPKNKSSALWSPGFQEADARPFRAAIAPEPNVPRPSRFHGSTPPVFIVKSLDRSDLTSLKR